MKPHDGFYFQLAAAGDYLGAYIVFMSTKVDLFATHNVQFTGESHFDLHTVAAWNRIAGSCGFANELRVSRQLEGRRVYEKSTDNGAFSMGANTAPSFISVTDGPVHEVSVSPTRSASTRLRESNGDMFLNCRE